MVTVVGAIVSLFLLSSPDLHRPGHMWLRAGSAALQATAIASVRGHGPEQQPGADARPVGLIKGCAWGKRFQNSDRVDRVYACAAPPILLSRCTHDL